MMIDHAISSFSGDVTYLERAIGIYFVGLKVGWKPLLLMNDPRIVRRSELILRVKFSDVLPDVGLYACRSVAWRAFDDTKSFWRTMRGDFPCFRSVEMDFEEVSK